MFNIGMWALFRIAFRTEKYLVRARDFPKDVNNICRQRLIFRNSSLNKLRIEYNWVKKFSSNIYSYERGRKYSTLEGMLFSKLLFERTSIWSGHVITTHWFRFQCQWLLGSIQGCFKSHHPNKNSLVFSLSLRWSQKPGTI